MSTAQCWTAHGSFTLTPKSGRLWVASDRSFKCNRMKIFDLNHVGPCGKIGTLVVEIFGGIVVTERGAPGGDDDHCASAEHSDQSSLIKCKENVLLRANVDQMFEALWNTEAPHRH